jgi:hypothetical protein
LAVGNAGGLHDGRVITHVIDKGDEPVRKNGVSNPDFPIRIRDTRPPHGSGIVSHVAGTVLRKIKAAKEVMERRGKT